MIILMHMYCLITYAHKNMYTPYSGDSSIQQAMLHISLIPALQIYPPRLSLSLSLWVSIKLLLAITSN